MSNDDTQRAIEIATKAAYDMGFRDGLRSYAHWKDGLEYVGTCGTRLSIAIEERRESIYYRPPIGRATELEAT